MCVCVCVLYMSSKPPTCPLQVHGKPVTRGFPWPSPQRRVACVLLAQQQDAGQTCSSLRPVAQQLQSSQQKQVFARTPVRVRDSFKSAAGEPTALLGQMQERPSPQMARR